MLAVILMSITMAGCLQHRKHAPTAAHGSWLVAVNEGVWGSPDDGGTGGLGIQVLAYRAPVSHLLVGGRLTGLTGLDIDIYGDDGDDDVPHLVDLGPVVGTGASLGRLSTSISAGPLLTHVKRQDDGWRSSWTLGVGADVGLAVRLAGATAVGLHGFTNHNREASAVGVAIRLETSFFP